MREINIYLAGGMSNLPFDDQVTWREGIKNMLESYEGNIKANVCSPTDYFNFESIRHNNEREVMEFDLNKIRHSDLIIVNFNDPKSLGTMAELAIAYDRQIPIIGLAELKVLSTSGQTGNINYGSIGFNKPTLHPWQEVMCHRIFNNIDDLIIYVKEFYLT